MHINLKSIFIYVSVLMLQGCPNQTGQPGNSDQGKNLVFTTWDNICYDRAASVWLIHRFVDSSARFRFEEFGKKIRTGIPFDVPGAELGRQKNLSCFETVIKKYNINDPGVKEMAKIVHDIDVNIWGPKKYIISDSLDQLFKNYRNQTDEAHQLLTETGKHFEMLYHELKTGKHAK